MRAAYLENLNPMAQRAFDLRQPTKQINHSEIFSLATVEQGSLRRRAAKINGRQYLLAEKTQHDC